MKKSLLVLAVFATMFVTSCRNQEATPVVEETPAVEEAPAVEEIPLILIISFYRMRIRIMQVIFPICISKVLEGRFLARSPHMIYAK